MILWNPEKKIYATTPKTRANCFSVVEFWLRFTDKLAELLSLQIQLWRFLSRTTEDNSRFPYNDFLAVTINSNTGCSGLFSWQCRQGSVQRNCRHSCKRDVTVSIIGLRSLTLHPPFSLPIHIFSSRDVSSLQRFGIRLGLWVLLCLRFKDYPFPSASTDKENLEQWMNVFAKFRIRFM